MRLPATVRSSVRFGPFTVDLVSHELRCNQRKTNLQEQPFQVLAVLLEQPGELVTREELRERLWPADTFVDFEHGINTAIKKVREALEDSGDHPKFIETLPRRGYRFIAPVEVIPSTPRLTPPPPDCPVTQPETWPLHPVVSSLQAHGHCRPGVALGHYQILEKIGAGGVGEVFRARDEHLDRDVAIKVLPPGVLGDESARKRFHKEALALSKVNHPNIATIHDFDTQQGMDFLVMEFIPGITLSEKLASGPLPEKRVVALGVQLAEGLSAAHERGVIHRDLKPGNLRLTGDGRLKILDFGLAKLRLPVSPDATTETLTKTQTVSGTLPYMAPEQLLGGEIDARADVYAAGMVLYEMATGQRPFAQVDRSQLISAILHHTPQPPMGLNPSRSAELERIIGKCLEKEPEDRYQSARELAIDLQRLHRETQSASSHAVARQEQSLWRAVPYRRTIVGVSIAVLAIVAAVSWYLYVGKKTPSSIAVLPFADLSPARDQGYFSEGLAEEILNRLTKIPNLKVTARGSAFQFKDGNEDSRVVGRKLDVADILEGSVQRAQDRIRVTAHLIRAEDGFDLWSESFDRDLKDIFAVEDDIAKAVTSALQLKLLASMSSSPPTRSGSTNPEAYEAFLHARYFAHMLDEASGKKALQYADEAIQFDSNYAPAYALRANIELYSGEMMWTNLPEDADHARRDTEKAIALDPNLADGYRDLSQIQSMFELNCPEAETSLKRASDLAPGDPDNLQQGSMLAMCQGSLEKAVGSWKQELLLDPLRPEVYLWLAQGLRVLDRYPEAYAALAKAQDLNSKISMAHEVRGEFYLAQGRPQDALAEIEKEPQDLYRDLGEALAYHTLGRHRESDEALARLIARESKDAAYQIAQVYGYRGEVDRTFEWLGRAYAQHDAGLMWLKTDPKMQSLHKDPRYGQLLKKMNLSE